MKKMIAAVLAAVLQVTEAAMTQSPQGVAGATNALPAASDAPRAQPSRPPDREVLYKQTPQGPLRLFVYLPEDWKATDRRPAIVFFFGGGWKGGTPAQFYRMAEYLSGRGLVAFAAEYRVQSKHGTTPLESVEDARTAIRFIRKHAAEWGADPNRLISSGGSAGGHLAACLGVDAGPDAAGDDLSISARPQAMVLFNPVLDMAHPRAAALLAKFGEPLRRKLEHDISPLAHLDGSCPPGILFFGTADALVDTATPFVEKAQSLGLRMELWTAAGMTHGFFNRTPWQEAVLRASDSFLTSLGYLSGRPAIHVPENGVLIQSHP